MSACCVKCGEKIPLSEAIRWDEGPSGHRYICPECYVEEENYEVEPDDVNYEKVKDFL